MIMRRFLKHIALFSSIVLLLLGVGEVYVERLPNPARDKHAWMTAHHDDVRTLVLGDSHAFYGLRPDLLGEGAFSLALPSQTLRYDDYLLRHYLMPQLRDVVLTVSYFTLWEDFELLGGHEQEIARYHIYMDADLHPWPLYRLECVQRQAFVERLKSLYQPSRLSWDALGWGDNYSLDRRADDWDNGEARAAANTYSDSTVVAFNEGVLASMMDFCRERGVRLTLVTTPTGPLFRQHQSEQQVATNRRVLSRLLQQHPEVRHYDLEADPRFTSDDFYDADHLSDVGAAKLTKILHETLQKQGRLLFDE